MTIGSINNTTIGQQLFHHLCLSVDKFLNLEVLMNLVDQGRSPATNEILPNREVHYIAKIIRIESLHLRLADVLAGMVEARLPSLSGQSCHTYRFCTSLH